MSNMLTFTVCSPTATPFFFFFFKLRQTDVVEKSFGGNDDKLIEAFMFSHLHDQLLGFFFVCLQHFWFLRKFSVC